MDKEPILKNRKLKLILLEGLFIFLIILLGGVIYLLNYQRTYANKIYPNVQFSDINLGGKTSEEAATLLENYNTKIGQQKIIVATETKSTELTFADAGVFLDVDKMLDVAYQTGRDNNFFKEIYVSAETIYDVKSIKPIIKTDQNKFSSLVDRISSDLNEKAVDAGLTINSTTVTISASKKGLTVDRDDLIAQLASIIETGQGSTITAKTIFADPSVVENNLTSAKAQAESLMKKTATITGGDQSFYLSGSQIGSLISFPKNTSGQVVAAIDSNKVTSYVANTIAKKIDIAKVDRKISQLNQAILQEGSNGRHVDRTDAQNKIINLLNSSQLSTAISLSIVTDIFSDVYVLPDEGTVPGRFAGRYIDVDLTHQLMTLFETDVLVAQYQVSTGKWSTPTPTGTRYVINKNPRAWSAPYGLYMPWWMGLGGGYGIHELPEWPNGHKEGESHLGTPVSHGCIRLGVGPAQTVYNWSDIGTPVYIHK